MQEILKLVSKIFVCLQLTIYFCVNKIKTMKEEREYEIRLTNKLVNDFVELFNFKIGYRPIVITSNDRKDVKQMITLQQLKNTIDDYLLGEFGRYDPKTGKKLTIVNRTRIRNVVECRMIYFKAAHMMGFSLKHIGESLTIFDEDARYDHTTVIHAIKTFDDLYETSDKFVDMCNAIQIKLKNKYQGRRRYPKIIK